MIFENAEQRAVVIIMLSTTNKECGNVRRASLLQLLLKLHINILSSN